MGFFSKEPTPPSREDRIAAFRQAVYAAQVAHKISIADVIAILGGIIEEAKKHAATTAPLPSAMPRVSSGNKKGTAPVYVTPPFRLPPGLREEQPRPRSLVDLIAGR